MIRCELSILVIDLFQLFYYIIFILFRCIRPFFINFQVKNYVLIRTECENNQLLGLRTCLPVRPPCFSTKPVFPPVPSCNFPGLSWHLISCNFLICCCCRISCFLLICSRTRCFLKTQTHKWLDSFKHKYKHITIEIFTMLSRTQH